jgi:hypothetical protein
VGQKKRVEILQAANVPVKIPDFLATYVAFDKARIRDKMYRCNIQTWSKSDKPGVSAFIYSQLSHIIAHEHPEYMKVRNFGHDCAQVIYDWIPGDELDIYYSKVGDDLLPKPIYICDIFEKGIRYIL